MGRRSRERKGNMHLYFVGEVERERLFGVFFLSFGNLYFFQLHTVFIHEWFSLVTTDYHGKLLPQTNYDIFLCILSRTFEILPKYDLQFYYSIKTQTNYDIFFIYILSHTFEIRFAVLYHSMRRKCIHAMKSGSLLWKLWSLSI